MRSFFKGVLIGTACICTLALVWLFWVRPEVTAREAAALKNEYTVSGPRGNSGAVSIPKPETGITKAIDFSTLKGKYPDVIAWLVIPGSVVDYPVLQSSAADPEYYLRRNHKGEWRMAGSLFLQSDCTLDGRSLVIYGHNMTDGTMFACLPKYLTDDFRERHSTILLQTLTGAWEYRVWAVLETDVSRVPFNRTAFVDDADFQLFVQSLMDNAAVATDVIVSPESQLLILVTCSYSWPEARYVVVAVRSQGGGMNHS